MWIKTHALPCFVACLHVLASAHALDARDNPVDQEKVRLIEPLTLAPAERSPDGRPRYQVTLEVAGQPAPILLTPFAVAGNATVVATQFLVPYRTAFPTTAGPRRNEPCVHDLPPHRIFP